MGLKSTQVSLKTPPTASIQTDMQAKMNPEIEPCCPVCGLPGGETVWDGISHGRISQWVQCSECRTARETLAHPERRRSMPRPSPLTPDELHAEVLESDALISRLRTIGYGESWLRRPNPMPVLMQLGSGWGATLSAADWRGFEPIGVEPHVEQAEWARSRLGVMVFSAVHEIPVMPTDVILIEPFSQYDQPMALLQELIARLVPGGLMVITTPLLDHPWHRARLAEPPWSDPGHSLLFERAGLSLLLIRSGLMPEHAWHHPTRPGEAIIVARRG